MRDIIEDLLLKPKIIAERLVWTPALYKDWKKYVISAEVFLLDENNDLRITDLKFDGTVVLPSAGIYNPFNDNGKYSFVLSFQKVCIRRLDTQAKHRNPDGTEAGIPHKHFFVDGQDTKNAYNPTAEQLPGDRANINDMLRGFLYECNINYQIYIEMDFTPLMRFIHGN